MTNITKHDKQIIELTKIWRKLSKWNKIKVFSFAVHVVIKQKLKSLVRYL